MAPIFELRTRYVLLTYAQCGQLDAFEVMGHLSDVPAECVIARENHADGGVHLHAFVDFGKRTYFSDPRRFDVAGCHPNIQPCGRTPDAMFDYTIKFGDVICGGLGRPSGDDVSTVGTQWDRIVDAPTVEQFWELVRTLAPRMLLCNFNSLRGYAEWHYRPTMAPYVSPPEIVFDISGVEELGEFVRASLSGNQVGKLSYTSGRGYPRSALPSLSASLRGDPTPPLRVRLIRNSNSDAGRPKSLILYGETRLGKTLWARSLGPHIYCCLQFNVEDVRGNLVEAQYAVFDDMQGGFKFFPAYKGWLGAQKSFTVTDKYKGKTTIEWGRPTIWLMNESPSSCTDVDYDWLMGNCFIAHVSEPIFRANSL